VIKTVSWDLKALFLGHSPHITELVKLAKKHSFSNIEQMKLKKINDDDSSVYWFVVNDRGEKQT